MSTNSVFSRVPQRWIMCAMCSFSVAMVSFNNRSFNEIANATKSVIHSVDTVLSFCTGCQYFAFWERISVPIQLPDVYWDTKILSIVQNANFICKLLVSGPAGLLSDLGYSNYVLGGGMLLMVCSDLLLPMIAKMGLETIYVILKIATSIGEGTLYPSIISLISRWSTSSERNTFTALVLAGSYIGDTLGHLEFTFVFLGYRSWSLGSYIVATIGLFWLGFWFIFGYHSPADSPYISPFEHHKITYDQRLPLYTLKRLPWRKIFCSPSFLSLILLYCSFNWAIDVVIYETLKEYHRYILHFPEMLRYHSTILVNVGLPSTVIGGFLADWVIKHNVASNTCIKKIFAFTSVFCTTVLLSIASLVGCRWMLFSALTLAAFYAFGLANSTVYSSVIDLSPQNAGLLMGMMSCAKYICFFLNKFLARLVDDNCNPDQWRNKIMFIVLLASAMMIVFLFFGSGKNQRWDLNRSRAAASSVRRRAEINTVETTSIETIQPPLYVTM